MKKAEGTVPASASPPLEPVESGDVRGGENALAKCEGENLPEIIHASGGFSMEQKRFMVESFACFQDVRTICAEMAKRWNINPDQRHVALYDAGRSTCRMGRALRTYYAECRKRYIGDVTAVAISHQAHRLRLVSRLVDKATNSKDYAAALKGLELAAKEMGGALTSQHVVRHEGTVGHVHATVEEARRELTARLSSVVQGGLLLPMATATTVDATPCTPPPPTVDAVPSAPSPSTQGTSPSVHPAPTPLP